ncbi:MAG: UDP-N-acetylenolpyruvoylglucosamine reductase, partial [Spirochaetota bacterium]
PRWKIDDNHTKLSAAWLIERAGLKGYRINDAGISEKHSLFIVNYGKAKASDIIQIMERVQKEIKEKFNIDLYPEPQLVGFD